MEPVRHVRLGLTAAVLTAALGCHEGVHPQPAAAASPVVSPAPRPAERVGALPALPGLRFGEEISFVVMGDNRGDEDGTQAPVFLQLLDRINSLGPRFVFTTGDMIAGYEDDEAKLRRQWDGYRKAIAVLGMPIFHAAGNHDLSNPLMARIYRELWGPTYYAVDFACTRLIALDTETEHGRIGAAQFAWLEQQLNSTLDRRIFLFFHEPLFPVDGHIGSSLDVHPDERDKLHRLFVAHRERIAAVFAGHEHLYSYEERDGIKYYITGGAGAHLYAPREQGGFYHFVTVTVSPAKLKIDVVRVGEAEPVPAAVRVIKPGETLETWENRHAWEAWDESVGLSSTADHVATGKRALRMDFDFGKCQWPLVYTAFDPPLDLSGAVTLAVDVFVPDGLADMLKVGASIPGDKKKEKHAAPPVDLKPGWNTVRTDLAGSWLPPTARAAAKGIEWVLATEAKGLAGAVTFDNFRMEGATPSSATVLEDWEGMLAWGAWNGTVGMGLVTGTVKAGTVKEGRAAVRLDYDFARWATPRLFARLPARWDLSKVPAVTVEALVPPDAALPLYLGFVATDNDRHPARAVSLKRGWNNVRIPLKGDWLPAATRAAVTEIEWTLTGPGVAAGSIVLDAFRAERP